MTNFTLNSTLTTIEHYVLLSLTRNTLHGYGVCQQVAHDSDGTVIIATSTTYATLKRLVGQDLIDEIPSNNPQQSYRYLLTTAGRRALIRETQRLERLINHTHYKLGRKFGEPAPTF